jgi:hypothetical protein
MQYDFRSVYATILQDWLGVSGTELKNVLLKDFATLPILNTAVRPRISGATLDLEQNYPNPFRGATTLRYRVAAGDRVRLKLFDSNGALVRILVDGFHAPGTYTRNVDARTLAPGGYFYQLEVGGHRQQRPMQVLR